MRVAESAFYQVDKIDSYVASSCVPLRFHRSEDACGQLHPVAQHMAAEHVSFLDARGFSRRNAHPDIGAAAQPTPVLSGDRHGEGSHFVRPLQGDLYIAAVPGRRDADEHISRSAERFDLSREDFVKSKVVCDPNHGGGIRAESERREAGTITAKASDQLRRQVLRVGGTASVAAPEDLVSIEDRLVMRVATRSRCGRSGSNW